MARARGEHIPYVAYELREVGPCMACHARCPARMAVFVPDPSAGSARVLLCRGCTQRALAAHRAPEARDLLGPALAPVRAPALARDKLCHGCGRTWPRDTEHWQRDRYRADGLDTRCKPCARQHDAARYRQRGRGRVA